MRIEENEYFTLGISSLEEGRGRDLLLSCVLKKMGVDYDPHLFCYDGYGKPYLKNSSTFISISHSKNYIGVAASKKKIGLDIEYKKKRNTLRYIDRLISAREREFFLTSPDKDYFYYKTWCNKESFLKCIGIGIRVEMKSVEILDDKIYMSSVLQEPYRLFDSYSTKNLQVSVCVKI